MHLTPVIEDVSYEHQAPEASIQSNPPYRNFAYEPPSVQFSPCSTRIVSASDDKTLKIWNVTSGDCILSLEGHGYGGVQSAAFDSSGNRIVSASGDKSVKIWDAKSGECLQTLTAHSECVRSAAFDSSGTRIVSGSEDKTLKIWQLATTML